MRCVILVAVVLFGGCAHHVDSEERLMAVIEAKITLPREAKPLQKYRRFYAYSGDEPNRVVAVYTFGGHPKRLWLAENEMPIVLDGGCAVVTFHYNFKTALISSLSCN
jgi:hypothetical protein